MNKRLVNIRYAIKQHYLLDKKSRYKVLYGGRGGAKSHTMLRKIIKYMIKYQMRVVICRDTIKSIKRSVQQLAIDIINDLCLEDQFVMQNEEIRCISTGSVLFWWGLSDNLGSIKGLESVDICFVEEAAYVKEEAWRLLIPTIRKKCSEIWIAFNPRFETDWVSQTFLINDPPPGSIIEQVYYWDNTMLSKEAREHAEWMKQNDPEGYAHDYLGEHSKEGLAQQYITAGEITESQDRPLKSFEHYKKIAGLDIAATGDDHTCLIIRQGPKILLKKKWNRADHDRLSESLIPYLMGCDALYVDYTSWGYGLASRLKTSAPCPVYFVNGGDRAGSGYLNKRAEIWSRTKAWIKWGRLPLDSDLMQALLSPQYWFTNKNELQLEGKEKMRKRGLKSPDDGDALSYTMCDDWEERSSQVITKKRSIPKKNASSSWMGV